MAGKDIELLIKQIAKLPSLGSRSARCIVLHLLNKREADLWAMERVSLFKGKYHILGGVLSAMEGIVPEDLNIASLEKRVDLGEIKELVLALPATIDGQITSHYLVSRFKDKGIKITTLAQGIPMGAELDYMDEGTIQLALSSRIKLG